jgi:hypothetical protein
LLGRAFAAFGACVAIDVLACNATVEKISTDHVQRWEEIFPFTQIESTTT